MPVNPKIFKAYDIRGIYPSEINESQVYLISRAFVAFLKKKFGQHFKGKVVVARDGRLSSPLLAQAAIKGLVEEGIEAVSCGLASTPLFGWIVSSEGYDGGIMITASHNSKEFNGMKLVGRGATSIGETNGLQDILRLGEEVKVSSVAQGKVVDKDYTKAFAQFITESIKLDPLRVVIDTSNGVASKVFDEVFALLPNVVLHRLNWDINGHFPAHGPDPLTKGAADQASAKIIETRSHFGAVIDADGDRIVFLDEQGQVIRPDLMTALLASFLLKKHHGAKIVYDVPSSRVVREEIVAQNGIPLESRVGHFFVKETMRSQKAFFGGEHSGHYFFQRLGYSWGTELALLELIDILSEAKKPLSVLVSPLKKYVASGEINLSIEHWDLIADRLPQQFPHAHISRTDGISVEYPTWWFNIRPSHTENLLRLNVEAINQQLLEDKLAMVKSVLENLQNT